MTEVWRNIWFDDQEEFDDVFTFGCAPWSTRIHYDARELIDDEWLEVVMICLLCGNSISSCTC